MGTWPAEKHQEFVDKKRKARMKEVDKPAPDLRVLVHEYGYAVVHAFLDVGVRNPRHIKHLVETILNEFSPTRSSYSRQGKRTEVLPPFPFVEKLDRR